MRKSLSFMLVAAFVSLLGLRTVQAQPACASCTDNYDPDFNYYFHYFAPFGPDPYSCGTGEGCHGYAAAQWCSYYHWQCSSYGPLKSPERAFELLQLASAEGDIARIVHLLAVNKDRLLLYEDRGTILVRDCRHQLVGQVALRASVFNVVRRAATATVSQRHAAGAAISSRWARRRVSRINSLAATPHIPRATPH